MLRACYFSGAQGAGLRSRALSGLSNVLRSSRVSRLASSVSLVLNTAHQQHGDPRGAPGLRVPHHLHHLHQLHQLHCGYPLVRNNRQHGIPCCRYRPVSRMPRAPILFHDSSGCGCGSLSIPGRKEPYYSQLINL